MAVLLNPAVGYGNLSRTAKCFVTASDGVWRHEVNFAVPVLISARNRPLYLWATLDSLYRSTRYPHKFIFLDMASTDPIVRNVVAGFERRGMFEEVIWAERNDPEILWNTVWRISAGGMPYFGYVESDVVIERADQCWLERLVGLMQANPRLAMLGSAIDRRDFVDMEAARRLEPEMPDAQLRALIKANSRERMQSPADADNAEIFHPHNPPGRLLLVRSSALREVGPGNDSLLDGKFIAAGYQTGIATAVRHRHLSLLHIFDYPDYDLEARIGFDGRNCLMSRTGTMPREVMAAAAPALSNEDGPAKARPFSTFVRRFRSYFANKSMAPESRANTAVASVSAPSESNLRARFGGADRDDARPGPSHP